MLKLNFIDVHELMKVHGLEEVFPLTYKYLNSLEFQMPRYEWAYITNDEFHTAEARETWIGIVCVTENKYIPHRNLHLSTIEVAKPIRNCGFGTRIVSELIDIAIRYKYDTLSLHPMSKELEEFYKRFGMTKYLTPEGTSLMVLRTNDTIF